MVKINKEKYNWDISKEMLPECRECGYIMTDHKRYSESVGVFTCKNNECNSNVIKIIPGKYDKDN